MPAVNESPRALNSVMGSETSGVAKGLRPAEDTADEIAETSAASEELGAALSLEDVVAVLPSCGCGKANTRYGQTASESSAFIFRIKSYCQGFIE